MSDSMPTLECLTQGIQQIPSEQLIKYRSITQNVLNHYSQFKPIVGDTERFVSFDCDRDHYQLFTVGWNKHQRIYGCLIHIDIRDGKSHYDNMVILL